MHLNDGLAHLWYKIDPGKLQPSGSSRKKELAKSYFQKFENNIF